MARACNFKIVNLVSSNGKRSKPICKRKGIPTPPVRIILRCNKDGKLIRISALPDMGATVNLVCEAIATKHNMAITPNDGSLQLIDTEGRPLAVTGITYVDLQCNDGTWFNTPMLVSPCLRDPLLLSYTSQKAIGILHPEWPLSFKARQAHQPRLEISPNLM